MLTDEEFSKIIRYRVEWEIGLADGVPANGTLVFEVQADSSPGTGPESLDYAMILGLQKLGKALIEQEGWWGLVSKVKILPSTWEDNTGVEEVEGFGTF